MKTNQLIHSSFIPSTVLDTVRGRPLDIQVGARKNFEINRFCLKSGEKNICIQTTCISSVTENVKKDIFTSLGREMNKFSSPDLPSPPPGYLMVAPLQKVALVEWSLLKSMHHCDAASAKCLFFFNACYL